MATTKRVEGGTSLCGSATRYCGPGVRGTVLALKGRRVRRSHIREEIQEARGVFCQAVALRAPLEFSERVQLAQPGYSTQP